jgi:hypothetical protein
MKPDEIMNKIIEDSYIIKSALQAEDIEIVNETLERRQQWIDELEKHAPFDVNSEIGKKFKLFQEIDQACQSGFEAFKDKIEQEHYSLKNERKQMNVNKKVYNQYQMNVPGQMSGLSIDNKK